MVRFLSPILLSISVAAVVGDYVGGPSHDGKEIVCDLPQSELLKNKGGSDGAGLCVFTSLDRAARWANNPVLIGFRDWMTKHPGGGYPSKVDQMVKQKYEEYKRDHPDAQPPEYVQNTNGDATFMELALKTGRMVSCTYGYSPRYHQNISHMVNLVYLDSKWACVGDNNFPGTNEYEWVEREEFIRRWKMGGGGWSVVLLDAPAFPPPHN
jgi:hypothetical protein